MPDRIGVFMLAALILVAVPGPDVLYITARAIDQGRLAGMVSAFGAAAGGLVLTVAAALGLSAILESSAIAFSVIKYLGAAYLLYLGMRRLLTKDNDEAAIQMAQRCLAEAHIRSGLSDCRAQPQDGSLLRRVPATVR